MGVHWSGALSEAGRGPVWPHPGSDGPASLSALTGEGGVNESSPARRSADVASVRAAMHGAPEQDSTSLARTSPPAVSAFGATALSPQGRLLGLSGRAQLALVAAVTLGGPLGFVLYVIAGAVA